MKGMSRDGGDFAILFVWLCGPEGSSQRIVAEEGNSIKTISFTFKNTSFFDSQTSNPKRSHQRANKSNLRKCQQIANKENCSTEKTNTRTGGILGAQAIIPQGKHLMFVLWGSQHSSWSQRGVFPWNLRLHHCSSSIVNDPWLAWHEKTRPSSFSPRKNYYIRFQGRTDAAC